MEPVYTVDIFSDERWEQFLGQHPKASVFHRPAWLRALQLTYGYTPLALTTTRPGEPLANGIALCKVNSWITGSRLVSVPFSDHCDLLADSVDDRRSLLAGLEERARKNLRYVELRPLEAEERELFAAWQPSATFNFHMLSLDASSDQIFRSFHKDCIQRKIRRAEKEKLSYDEGRSEIHLRQFYKLLVHSRRRQGLPPQPIEWFRNLVRCFKDDLTIHLALHDGLAVAAILTLSYKDTTVYKYGCSIESYNRLGGMPFLFWKAIQQARDKGMRRFDLGRSDVENAGLTLFKDRLGAARSTVTYWRHASKPSAETSDVRSLARIGRYLFSKMPDSILVGSGRLLYKHVG